MVFHVEYSGFPYHWNPGHQDIPRSCSAQGSLSAKRPSPGWRAGSAPHWRNLPWTWDLASGPTRHTVLLILQQGKAGDLGRETANSLCFCFHLKRLLTLLHVQRTKVTISKRLSKFWRWPNIQNFWVGRKGKAKREQTFIPHSPCARYKPWCSFHALPCFYNKNSSQNLVPNPY